MAVKADTTDDLTGLARTGLALIDRLEIEAAQDDGADVPGD